MYLNETAGDLNVAQVLSQTGDVRLTADQSILDGRDGTGDPGADVLGNNLTPPLTAVAAAVRMPPAGIWLSTRPATYRCRTAERPAA